MNDEFGKAEQPPSAPASASASPSPVAPLPSGEAVPLKDCPPGLFRFDGCIGFKSEYGGGEPYVVKTGEIFWGGTNSPRDRNRLAVSPIPYAALATVAATNTTPAAKVERWRIMPREGGEMWMERWGSGEWVEYEKIKHLLSPVASAREEAGGESGKTSPVLTGDKLALPGGDAERRVVEAAKVYVKAIRDTGIDDEEQSRRYGILEEAVDALAQPTPALSNTEKQAMLQRLMAKYDAMRQAKKPTPAPSQDAEPPITSKES